MTGLPTPQPWLVLCTLKVIHIFAQTFSNNVDLQLFIHSMLSCKNRRSQWSLQFKQSWAGHR